MGERLLHESRNSKVFYSDEAEYKAPVVIKILNQEFPTTKEIKQFYHEYEVTKELTIKGIRKPLTKGKIKNRHTLVMEYVKGIGAKELSKQQPIDFGLFLDTAIAATQILKELHQLNIIHKDISAWNLIIDTEKRDVHLIDLGHASQLDLKIQHLGNPDRLEGNLSYISPEQTGRMNRVVDYRTDIYSLGVTFYEILTGQLPYVKDDPMELVHAHIATLPKRAATIRPEIPAVISDIIDIMMAKNAEDRYQSCYGLLHDLKKCKTQWETKKEIHPFTLKERDYSGKFQIHQKLYGRQKELDTLMGHFWKVAAGPSELLLVSGYSGTGKSALVHEIHRPITEKRGYFIEGKFDQFQREVPYFAFLQAFESFIGLILTENEENLAAYRTKIQQAVGAEGKVLTEVLPRLEAIIGPQAELPELGGPEAQNRFNFLFRKFIKAIATDKHPLVIFVDDLQWADTASLSLLKSLLSDKDSTHVFTICAYRDNEVNASHPFITTVAEIEKNNKKATRIQIGNLAEEDVHHLISDSLGMTAKETELLATLVFEKTRGNAFFVIQFLKSLYTTQLLYFDFEGLSWHWNIDKIRDKNITENVVELLAGNIRELQEESQYALKMAACIGNAFDLETLQVILETDEETIRKQLWEALSKGFIVPSDDKYKFSHDRVQQAVYSLIPKEDQPQIHLSIGKLLETKYLKQDDDHFLFDIANHLNIGSPLLTEATEKIKLARLNDRAAKKAMASSAFKPAFDYVGQGIELLPEDAWNSYYELNLSLHYLGAEAAYDIAEFDPMTQYIDAVLLHGRVMMDKIPVYALRINAFKASNKLDEAIDTGLEVLEKMGEKIPRKGPLPLVMIDLLKTKFMLRGKKKEDILKLPIMENQEKSAALRILNDIASPVYWARPAILPFVIFRMVQLSLRYGITEISAFGFATYGLLMCGVLGDMPEGYRFGQIGLALLEKFKAKKWLSQIYTPIYALINHWSEHIHLSLEPFLYSYRVGFETGAIEYACINVNIYCNHLYLGGKPLVQTEEEMRAFSESMLAFKQETNYNYNEAYRQAVLNLLGESEDVLLLIGTAFDETKMAIQNTERNDRAGDFHIHFHKMILNYLFRNYEEARVQADLGRPLLDAVLAKFDVAVFHFYEALVYLALAGETSSREQRRLLSRPNKNIKQFKKWAKYSPDNHSHKLSLLEAERYKVAGKDKEAKESYDKAVAGANKQNFLNEEALACERAGMFYEARGIEALTGHFIKLAFQAYREWGAQAKLNDLQSRYYDLTNEIKRSKRLGSDITISSTIEADSALDLQSVIKAATTISQEIVLANLLKQMMLIVMENAGAQRGSMFLLEKDKWVLKATGYIENDEVEVLQGKPLDDSVEVPISIIQYVARTNEAVVLEDAMSAKRFQADSYILENNPKSVLCLPIMHQGKITSILYLENNLVTAAFTQERIELLNLLSGQISVSIANAQVYETLEEKVKERTTEVVQQKEQVEQALLKLQKAQQQLVESEKMASLGQLTAGIAHEINNPINFVTSSVGSLKLDFQDLKDLLDTYKETDNADEALAILKKGQEFSKTIDKDFLMVEIGQLIASIQEGANRTAEIVGELRNFSRLDDDAIKFVDLHSGLESTLTLLKNKLSTRIKIKKNYGVLPKVQCFPGKINQVFVNILANSIQAMEKDEPGKEMVIIITTFLEDDQVKISIKDNGPGMSPDLQNKIFDPFFTTKDVGEGTGLGLSVSYGIVQRHHGKIFVNSAPGKGAEFIISLPIKQNEKNFVVQPN